MRAWRAAALSAALLLAACGGGQELYGKLSETQANEMVAVLRSAGIDAEKEAVPDGGFRVSAPEEDFAQSIGILKREGYPREEFADLGSVFKKEGFVSSPLEERARLVYGMGQELSNTISRMDGVVQARVQLALPEPDPMGETRQPASASVLVRHRPGYDMQRHVGEIRALVVNAVQGLPAENVTVVTTPATPLPEPPRPDRGPELGALAPVAVAGALAAGVFFGWPAFRRWRGGRDGRSNLADRR